MKASVLIGLILALGAVWLVTRKKEQTTASVRPPGVLTDPAIFAQGAITDLQVDMGMHRVVKAVGATITVLVKWSGATKNFAGQLVSWPYQVAVYFVDSTGVQNSVASFSPVVTVESLTAQTTQLTLTVPSMPEATVLGVKARLYAADSDAAGNPSSVSMSWIPAVELVHPSAVVIQAPAPATGPAQPQGAIGTVDVAQLILRQSIING